MQHTPEKYPELKIEYSDYDPGQTQTFNQPCIPAFVELGDIRINGQKIESQLYERLMDSIGELIREEILQKIEAGEIPG